MKQEEINNHIIDFATDLLDENHPVCFRMQGYSMFPTLKNGELGCVEKCNPTELKVGDIVIFKQNYKFVAHRLIKIHSDGNNLRFTAKGDKNTYTDSPFSTNELIGRLTYIQKKTKKQQVNSPIMKWRRFVSLHFAGLFIPFYNLLISISNWSKNAIAYLKSLKNNLVFVSKDSGNLFIINTSLSVLQGIVPFVIIVCIKALIDKLTTLTALNSEQEYHFLGLLILTAFVFLINGSLSEIKNYFSEKQSQSVTRRVYEILHNKHASLDLSHYENPTDQDKIHRAVQEATFRPIKIINELQGGIKAVTSALFLAGIFITIKWYLAVLLIVAIIPGVYLRLKFSRKFYKLKKSQSTSEREMYYFNRILTGFPFAKEMKLFGFFDFFKKRFYNLQESLFEEKITLRKSELWMNIFAQFFAVILIFVSLGYVSVLKIKDEISIGTVVLFFFAFQRGYSVLNDFFSSITRILEDNTFLNDFISFLDMPTKTNLQNKDSLSFNLSTEIKFVDVSFRYETSKRDALKSINITIPAGKTVAFVGANGSGKTTLIKLLCGFYAPDSGKILFDGVDSKLIGQRVICENITAVFQDFALYTISAMENIGLGNSAIPFDLKKAKEAAEAAGIDDVISKLPDGYSTLLGNQFNGGEELSIGQWQKIAIARAFYRDSSLIIMDEPSSALDAEAELQIIDSLRHLSHNKTAVIISHRLTTVQSADLIYLFNEGEVIEAGNHQELMALGGKYFTLFKAASKHYERN